MKIFRTGSAANITECQRNFNFLPVKQLLKIRTAKFLQRFAASENALCLLFNNVANQQLNTIFMSVDISVKSTRELVDKIIELFHSDWNLILFSQILVYILFLCVYFSCFVFYELSIVTK